MNRSTGDNGILHMRDDWCQKGGKHWILNNTVQIDFVYVHLQDFVQTTQGSIYHASRRFILKPCKIYRPFLVKGTT